MIQILQTLSSGHPQLNPHSVAAIQWQKQHIIDTLAGHYFQRVSDSVLPAAEARTPFTLRLEGMLDTSQHYGPYHITPLWDDASQCLKLEVSNDRFHTPDSKPFLTLSVPTHMMRHECSDYANPKSSGNTRIRSKLVGAEKLRDRLIEQNCTISDSFAAALFEAVAGIKSDNLPVQECH